MGTPFGPPWLLLWLHHPSASVSYLRTAVTRETLLRSWITTMTANPSFCRRMIVMRCRSRRLHARWPKSRTSRASSRYVSRSAVRFAERIPNQISFSFLLRVESCVCDCVAHRLARMDAVGITVSGDVVRHDQSGRTVPQNRLQSQTAPLVSAVPVHTHPRRYARVCFDGRDDGSSHRLTLLGVCACYGSVAHDGRLVCKEL